MIKVQILTATTVEILEDSITHWSSDGWYLHEGVVVTAWGNVQTDGSQGQSIPYTTACGFLQVMTRAEGTCRAPKIPSETA